MRCESMRTTNAAATMLGPVLGPALDKHEETVQCKGEEGHDGNHFAYVCPFPGFADNRVEWAVTTDGAAKFAWYDDREVFHDVLTHAVDTGEITQVRYMLDVIEKPWHFDELHEAWEKGGEED